MYGQEIKRRVRGLQKSDNIINDLHLHSNEKTSTITIIVIIIIIILVMTTIIIITTILVLITRFRRKNTRDRNGEDKVRRLIQYYQQLN